MLLAACVPQYSNRDTLQFMTQVMSADLQTREQLWTQISAEPQSLEDPVRVALMQSVPGHSGYDPAVAQTQLQELLDLSPEGESTPVMRLRLAELKESADCRNGLARAKRRLEKVVDIERKLKSNGH